MPFSASMQSKSKTVRVGWYDSSFNTIDESGYRTGYAYEYQLKLSSYNGWTYEYVKGSWSDLLHMLETGELDLLKKLGCQVVQGYYFSSPIPADEFAKKFLEGKK